MEIKKESYAALFLMLTDGLQDIVSGLWMSNCNGGSLFMSCKLAVVI